MTVNLPVNVKADSASAADTTLAPGEGISRDHTFRLRHQQREMHVPLPYQPNPSDVVSLDLGRNRGQDQVPGPAELAQ